MNTLMTIISLKEKNKYHTVKDIKSILLDFLDCPIVKNNKKISYYNIPLSFDTETSSFRKSNQLEKVAIMYEWSLCINGYVIIGRTWEEFNELYNTLVNFFKTNEWCRLVIYVHNLSYDFQFIRKRLNWLQVFSLDERKPLKAVTLEGIEFRCSYLLSGYNLETLAKNLHIYDIKKLKGDLDYRLVRTSKTPLYEDELKYCINDVLIVVCYIQEQIERCVNIYDIPLTKTGFVRNYTRDMCLYGSESKRDNNQYHKYRSLMSKLTMDRNIYTITKSAFSGGFTHANPYWVNEIVHNVKSYDFTSSYPYVLVSEKFPMSKFRKIKVQSVGQFENTLKMYCCLIQCEFFNIESIIDFETYISSSHCTELREQTENNGRVVKASHLIISITEQDYFIIKNTYKWSNVNILNMYIADKQYLPKQFVLSILKKYSEKTVLKDVKGKEAEYLNAKETVNAEYGMCVTDPCRDEILYDNNWDKEINDIDKSLNSYNKSVKRFLYYPWGIWVTAYARRNLWSAILEFKNDYIYSDTDSVKVINYENHIKYINLYDDLVRNKLKKAMLYHNLDYNLTAPKNIYGEIKQLGIWSDEGVYTRFKTLGAKRYITEKNNKISITVSGVNKKEAVPYLLNKYKDKIFENFNNGLYIPAEYTGKLTHTYIDERRKGTVKDYLGNIGEYDELSSIHLEPASYDMSLAQKFVNFLLDIKVNLK